MPDLNAKMPLLADCPVNIECVIEQAIDLDSYTLFIKRVLEIRAERA